MTDAGNHDTIDLYSKVLYRKGIDDMERIIREKMRLFKERAGYVDSDRALIYMRLWCEFAAVLMEAGIIDNAELEAGREELLAIVLEKIKEERMEEEG